MARRSLGSRATAINVILWRNISDSIKASEMMIASSSALWHHRLPLSRHRAKKAMMTQDIGVLSFAAYQYRPSFRPDA